NMEEKKKYLLRKVEDRTIVESETLELTNILNKNAKICELDNGVQTLIILGLSVLGGYLMAKLLEKSPLSIST
ncbi:MAG: hypothetical protein QMD06_05000, partial [Candidatus Altarchaeum sp.]|nr:hypothetical protein [Candidatus Altarchaeum sp.]